MSIRYIVEIGDPITHRFASTVRSPITQSNATYPDSLGNPINYPVRLLVPRINSKISDSISGATLLTQYSVDIENSDGKFDDVESLGWFNVPLTLKRSNIENPTLEDFNTILMGEISYPIVSEDKVTLVIDNIFRTLTDQSCKIFSLDDYPNLFDNVVDKAIPIGYGDLLNVPLYRVDPSEYIALDKDYITAVSAVYDISGNSIAFTFNPANGQINAIDATTADVTGRSNNKIGSIITTEIQEKAFIVYNSDNWDMIETNEFILNDSFVNFYYDGGTVTDLVNKVLKNDNAFLFTKNNGKLTIRQWGRLYKKHIIKNWVIMKFPKKDYRDAQKYFNSSVVLKYDKNIKAGIYDNQILIGDDTLYDRTMRKTYNLDLYRSVDLLSLGDRLIRRFGTLSEIIDIYSGTETYEINLLDLIILDVNINGRQFSNKTEWIVREVDPGQDTIVLEARSGFIEPRIINGILSQPRKVLSQPLDTLSQPISILV